VIFYRIIFQDIYNKESSMATHIVVMGYGQVGNELNWRTQERVGRALSRYAELRDEKKEVRSIIFTSGCGKGEEETTLAMQMEGFARDLLIMIDFTLTTPQGRAIFITNRTNPEVWGTIQEMKWAYGKAKEIDSHPVLEFVTNARHGRRVLFTNKMLTKIPLIEVIRSYDPPSVLWHELLAYAKVILYTIGATKSIERIEKVRRKHYSAG
jgi:hypothetical protein